MTKTPQQIKNEVEKEIENLREGCGELIGLENVDLTCGEEIDNPNSESGCSFLLCEECRKKLIKAEAKLSILTEYDKSIKEMIERLKDKDFIMSILQEDVTIDVEEGMKFIDIDGVRNKIDKQILSKIGDDSEVEK